jgi:phycobilisome rod-core linker protein
VHELPSQIRARMPVIFFRRPQLSGGQISAAWVGGQPPKSAQTIWLAFAAIGDLEVLRVVLTSAGAMLGTGPAG